MDVREFELFVDGELSEQEQRAMLLRAEADPTQWRGLALAFVEAQLLRRELGELVGGADKHVAVGSPCLNVERNVAGVGWQHTTGQSLAAHGDEGTVLAGSRMVLVDGPAAHGWMRTLAMAASLLVAVGVGLVGGREWARRGAGPMRSLGNEHQIAVDPQRPGAQPFAQQPLGGSPSTMTLVGDDGTSIQLPVYDAAQYADATSSQRESAMPREVLRALRSTGHEVRKHQRLMPIELGDGRQVVVPVEQLDVEFVGNRAFQ